MVDDIICSGETPEITTLKRSRLSSLGHGDSAYSLLSFSFPIIITFSCIHSPSLWFFPVLFFMFSFSVSFFFLLLFLSSLLSQLFILIILNFPFLEGTIYIFETVNTSTSSIPYRIPCFLVHKMGQPCMVVRLKRLIYYHTFIIFQDIADLKWHVIYLYSTRSYFIY